MKRFIFLPLILIFLISCREIVESHYENRDDALRDNAISRGWIPDNIPISASQIHEIHDLDTNELAGSFVFLPKHRSNFEKSMRRDIRKQDTRVVLDGRAEWGYGLEGKQNKSTLSRKGFVIYKYKEYGMAVQWDNGHAYYWNYR